MASKKAKALLISGISLATLTVVVNVAAFGFLGSVLDSFFAKGSNNTANTISKEEAKTNARNLCEEIESEGIVLLENKNNCLPFANIDKINVLGYRSTNIYYGGTGSGSASTDGNITLISGLKDNGIVANPDLVTLYGGDKTAAADGGVGNTDFKVEELPLSKYQGSTSFESLKAYSENALVVIGRGGGEGNDLPVDKAHGGTGERHYLELSIEEEALIQKASETFKNVVVILNTANAMELGFLDKYSNVSALFVGQPGSTGCASIAKVLKGEVNPSGRLPDIYAYDSFSSPATHAITPVEYTDLYNGKTIGNTIEYSEGIYVGYRWYETASAEKLINYDEVVQYPFGYGLSYSSFNQEIVGGTANNQVISGTDTINVEVKVSNTSSVKGKEVVQLYYNPPYTNGGIEKASKNLVDFSKIEVAANGEETITLSFKAEDMASYDVTANNNKGAYVLEKGKYTIYLAKNSHDSYESIELEVKEDYVYASDNKRSTDEVEATNQFSDAKGDVTYLSRKDGFKNLSEATKPTSNKASAATIEALTTGTSSYTNEDGITPLAVGKAGNVKFSDIIGKDYDDPMWDELISSMTVAEMQKLIGFGGYKTFKVESIEKEKTLDTDGPAGLSYYMNKENFDTTAYCIEVMIAATFNTDLAKRFGEAVGDEANVWGFTGWYAPGCNTHRTPFGGRNYEYFSEDGLLSGKMAAGVASGARSKGVVTYSKHFALNDQETRRTDQVCTWANEQAIREIYLKPFEISVKEGGSLGIMTSYNFIGNKWTGGMKELCTNVLRNEWGFKGVVITDYGYGAYTYMNSDKAIRAGNDMMLSTIGLKPADTSSAGIYYMQKASKDILYSVATAQAASGAGSSGSSIKMEPWRVITLVVDGVVSIASISLIALGIIGLKKKDN